MNHLKPIPRAEHSLSPTHSRNDRSVMLHSDTIALKPELGDELVETWRLRKRGETPRLPVQNYRERHDPSSLAGDAFPPPASRIR
jgi:hypothetical protein